MVDEIQIANQAKRLMEDEMFKDTLSLLEDRYLSMTGDTKWDAEQDRERLYYAVKGIRMIRKHLKILVDKGQLKDSQINKDTKQPFQLIKGDR